MSFRLPLSCLLLLSAACGGSNEGSAPATAASGPMAASASYEVRADAKRVDAAAWDSMSVAHDGPDVWLKPDAKGADWLVPGAVVVIPGRGVLKVASVKEDGDHLVIEKGDLAFSDFIENGTIDLHGATTFDAKVAEDPSEFDVRVAGDPPVQTSGEATPQSLHTLGFGQSLLDSLKELATDGWKIQKQISGDGNSLHYDITLSKNSGAFIAKLHAVGTINDLQTAFQVAVQNHVTSQQTFDVKTSGDADLSWEVGISEGSVGYNKILLPGISYKQQFFVGEVPMVMKVKSGFALIVGATGKNSTTTGRVHLTYSSDGGVHVDPGSGDANATGTGDASYADDRGSLAVGPSAYGFVATLPKIEIGVGVDNLFVSGAYFSNSTTTILQSPGGIAGNPCSDIDTKFTGTVGLFVDAGWGGKALTAALEHEGTKLSKKIYDVDRKASSCGLK